jgi:protein NirF
MSHHATGTDDTAAEPVTGPLALVKQLRGSGLTAIDAGRHRSLGQVGQGRQPHGLVVAPGGRWGYVPYAGSSEVEVIDLHTLSVAERVESVGTAPVGATLTRTGRHLFVSTYGELPSHDEPGIAVLETEGRSVELVAERPVGKTGGIEVDARNDVWAALPAADQVVRVSGTPPFAVETRLEMPTEPQDLVSARDFGLLGINSVGEDAVTFVDVFAGSVLGAVDAPNPRGGTPVPRSDRWFLGDTEGDGVTVVDLGAVRAGSAGPDAVERVPLGTPTAFTDVTPDGSLLAVDAYEDDRVTFLDPETLEVVDRVRTGETPRHPRFSPDGEVCYVPNVDADTVSVLDTAAAGRQGGQVRELAEVVLPDGAGPAGCFRTDRRSFP